MSGKGIALKRKLEKLGSLYKSNRLQEAIHLARLIIEKDPKDQFSHKVLAAALAQSGKRDEALNVNQKLILLAPQDPQAHINLGIMLNQERSHIKAEACFKTAKQLDSKNFYVYFNLGLTEQKLQKLDEAVTSYMRARELKYDYPQTQNNLSSTLIALRRFEEAEVFCREAIALKTDYALAHCNLGQVLRRLGNLEESKRSFTQALTLRPGFEEALIGRWRLLFEMGEFQAALSDSETSQDKDSVSRSLSCLFALDQTEEIYNRLRIYSNDNDQDISIAAFSAFISHKNNRESNYNFCNDPLEFIYFNNLSSLVPDHNKFIKQIISTLENIPTIWEPSSKTTKKGFQSLQETNLFDLSNETISHLKSIIFSELDHYLSYYATKDCTFIKKWPTKKTLFGWHVILKQQGYQGSHIHSGGWLSGVIYLKVVPSLGKNEGAIEFCLNGETYSDSGSPKLTYLPKEGDLVLFPSCLHHKTIPFKTDADRIVIAFDLKPSK